MSHNPLDWSDGIPDCIIFASTADAERGAAMYRSMADALDAKDARIKELEWLLSEAMEFVESDYTGTRNKDLTGRNLIHRAREALK